MASLVHGFKRMGLDCVGISSYQAGKTCKMSAIFRSLGMPLLIHQPLYSLLNRWVDEDLLYTLQAEGVGCMAFSPLAPGLLTSTR